MALVVEPGMVVVADLHEVEARVLGEHSLPDQLRRTERLRRQLVSHLHVILIPHASRPLRPQGSLCT